MNDISTYVAMQTELTSEFEHFSVSLETSCYVAVA